MMYCKLKISVYLLCAIVLAALNALPAAASQTFNVQETYENAFYLVKSGDPYQAVVELIEAGRQVPGDDASIADALVGPAQFAGFIGALLLDMNQRLLILTEVIDEEHALDRLLVAALKAFSGIHTYSHAGIAQLETDLARADNLPVRVAALYLLGSPYYFSGFHRQTPSVAELALVYPNLEITRHIVETPVWRTARTAARKREENVYLLRDVVYAGGRRTAVLQKSPGLQRIAERMPSLNLRDVTDERLAAWGEDLLAAQDSATRYALVCWLASLKKTPEYRVLARPGLEALLEPLPTTPEAVYARILLAEFDREERRMNSLRNHIAHLLPTQPLPSTPERCLYIETVRAMRRTAAFFTLYGFHNDAIRIYEAIAACYPNSALATSVLGQAQTVRNDPLAATLAQIERLIARFESVSERSNDKMDLIELFTDILENTDYVALRNIIKARLRALEAQTVRSSPPQHPERPSPPSRQR